MTERIEISVQGISSFGDIEGIYEDSISIERDSNDEISIGLICKDKNDDRSCYIVLNKNKALYLSSVLAIMAKNEYQL